MHLYTGLRQKGAKLLMRVPCVGVADVSLRYALDVVSDVWKLWVRLDGALLDPDETELFLRCDGFRPNSLFSARSVALRFWFNQLPFNGQIYHWDFAKRVLC